MSLEKVFQGLSWFCYILLGSASLYFITYSNVLGKYMAERTATIEYEEPVEERPTITVQFVSTVGEINLNMGKDFYLSLWIEFERNVRKIADLSFGNNEYSYGTIQVTEGRDIKNTTTLKISTNSGISKRSLTKEFHGFQFNFNKSIPELKDLRVYFRLTSKDNFIGYGEPLYDGDPLVQNIYPGNWMTLEIQPIQYHFLNLKRPSCRKEPFIKSIFQNFSKSKVEECSKKCNPMDFESFYHGLIDKEIPDCETNKEKECMDNYIKHNIVKDMVKKPCHKLQYSGKILNENFDNKNKNLVTFWYHFAPGLMIVKEEYLIYDLISMIGSVGGTLGLCVGFSFFGLIEFLPASLKMFIPKHFKSGSVKANTIMKIKQSEVELSNVEISKILQTEEFQKYLRKELDIAITSMSKKD